MNNDHYKQLSTITDQLLKLCYALNQQRDIVMASKLIPITSDLGAFVH